MLVYDVNAFPADVDINVWYELFLKGLAIYDSQRGEKPFQYDKPDLSLVDIRDMSQKDMLIVSQYLDEVNKRYEEEGLAERNKVMENNKKLINYLKTINDEQTEDLDQKDKIQTL